VPENGGFFYTHGMDMILGPWDVFEDRIVGEITMMYHACKVRSGLFPTFSNNWRGCYYPILSPQPDFFCILSGRNGEGWPGRRSSLSCETAREP